MLHWVRDKDSSVYALIIEAGYQPNQTQFLTPHEYNQQLGFIVYPKDGTVLKHSHVSTNRNILGISEVLIIREGKCIVYIYNKNKVFLMQKVLKQGDLILLLQGWHKIDFLEDTILLEIKQGPYLGIQEKIFA